MRLPGSEPEEEQEPLGVLLLPGKLEDIPFAERARDLLSIPRVVALEPPRVRLPRFLRSGAGGSPRQAGRLKFPGRVRLLVLYDPEQYPLARSLLARYEDTELWYLPPARSELEAAEPQSLDYDALARERATRVLEDGLADPGPLRERLTDLGVISPYAFVPGTRARRR